MTPLKLALASLGLTAAFAPPPSMRAVKFAVGFASLGLTAAFAPPPSMPPVKFAVGFNNSNCEAHPHAGVELADGGWLMVGDSQCWDGSAPYKRGVFVVVAEPSGAQRWTRVLGDLGFNYGKYGSELADGTIVVGGAKSVRDADAARAGYAYIEVRALWRLDAKTGALLSETTFPNDGKLHGLRDGVMCATPTSDGTNGLVATGYVGGEANYDGHDYDDEPMFLIFNGKAFAARLTYSTDDTAAPPTVEWVTDLGLNASYGFVPMQGMRTHMRGDTVAVSAAANTGPYGGGWGMQFSLMNLDATTGALRWAKMYAKADGSHPYSMTLSPPGDPEPGFVIAGHCVGCADQPIGRLLKARASDGSVAWDRIFTDRDDRYWNIECYGVDFAKSGGAGYIVTCGNGPETIPKWMTNCSEQTWTAFLYRTDAKGKMLWKANATDAAKQCINDAGEHVVAAKDGGFAVYVDSGTLGKPGTGGNFGLVRLDPEGR